MENQLYVFYRMKFIMITPSISLIMIVLSLSYHSREANGQANCKYTVYNITYIVCICTYMYVHPYVCICVFDCGKV